MSQEEEDKKDEEGRIKVFITFQEKTVLFSANPKYTLKTTMDNLKRLANAHPDKFWHLPEIDNHGQRITYYLGRIENKIIFHNKSNVGDEQSLERYGVRAGDKLKIIRKVIAG
jgi:hypothetical protein